MGSISFCQVTKQFGASVYALNDLSLEIRPGELVALLGSSGCGKTTLLKVVAGLEQPSSGKILIDGREVTQLPTRDRPIGMVFQSYALFPNMTVRQNIAFPLQVRQRSSRMIQQRVDELLELVQLTEQVDRYPKQLSGGQQQRTALARALAASPKVLLLDEPFSALDAIVRQQLREQIRQIQQTLQITTLFVTHDQSEALAIADRVAVMSHGKLEQVASPLELYQAPTTRFSAAFIGSRNALELPIESGRIQWGNLLDLSVSGIAGERAILFLRPEDIEISDPGQGHPAVVENKSFQGNLTRLRLSIEIGGQTAKLYADLPTRQAIDLSPGKVVYISINPTYAKVFAVND